MRAFTLPLTLTTALCAAPALAQTQFEFWHAFTGKNGNAVDAMAAKFNAAQDDYEMVPVYTGKYDEGTQRLQAAIAGNTAPAMVMLEITRYGLFAERGALEPLAPYMEAAGSDWSDQIRPFAMEASKYLGESYVIPFNVSTPVMYYNADLFEAAGITEVPDTWDEVLAAAQTLTDGEGQYGLNPPPQWVRWAMTNQAGGGWVDPLDNAVQIDMDESIFAYQTAADWVNVHQVASYDAALDDDLADQFFAEGRVGIEFNSTGRLARYLDEMPFEVGVAPLPCQAVCAAPIGGATLGIVASAEDEQKQGAWAFIQFATTPENSAFIFTDTGYLPIVEGAMETPEAQAAIEANPGYLVASNQLDIAFARARPPAMPAIRSAEPAVWQSIVTQQQDAETALTDFANQMRGMLATN
ncbi:MAG: ABC transporter substrate-binding protein [Pseudomonadota bacterium]